MANKASDSDLIGTNLGDILIAEAKAGRGRITVGGGAGDDVLFAGHTPVFVDDQPGNYLYDHALNIDDPSKWTVSDDGLVADPAIPHATILGTGTGGGRFDSDWFSFTLTKKCLVTFNVAITNTGGDGSVPWDTWIIRTYADHHAIDTIINGSRTVDFRPGVKYFSVEAFTDNYNVPEGWSYVVTISTTGHASTVPVAVTGDDLDGGKGDDRLFGSAGDDRLDGGAGTDHLTGGGGVDILLGGLGGDVLEGGDGADRLAGRTGTDTLTGGAGSDTFVLRDLDASDTITDFTAGEDRFELARTAFDLRGRTLDASLFHLGTAAGDADDRIVYDADTGALWFDADGSGTGTAIQLATISNHAAITAADFTLI